MHTHGDCLGISALVEVDDLDVPKRDRSSLVDAPEHWLPRYRTLALADEARSGTSYR